MVSDLTPALPQSEMLQRCTDRWTAGWTNHLELNTSQTKEMMENFSCQRPHLQPVEMFSWMDSRGLPSQERSMPELPEKADLLKHLLTTAADGLPVCGDQHYGETSKNRDNGRPARLVRTASLVTGEGTNCCPSRTTSTTQMDPETAWFPIRPVQDIPVEELPLLSAFCY